MTRLLLVLFVLVLPATVRAQSPEEGVRPPSFWEQSWSAVRGRGATGAFRLDYFRSSKALDDETDFFGGTAQIKLLPEIGDRVDGKVEIRLTHPDFGDDGADLKLLEGYATVRFKRADIRIGRQIVAWGRADGINPTDNLTPRDYTVLLPFEDDQRFGTAALRVDGYFTDEVRLTLFATPWFEPSKIPLPFPAGLSVREKIPARSPSNTEIGLKLDRTGARLDWSVSYYHGFDLLPDARVVSSGLELRHNRIDVFGADAARTVGRFGFRVEAAYVLTADREGRDSTVKNPFFFGVAGVDRKFLENASVNLQGVFRWVQNFRDPAATSNPFLRSVAIQNAIFGNQQDRTSIGFTSRISNTWLNDTLEAEILTFVQFRRANAYVRPLLTYAFTDHFAGTIGGEITQGPRESTFGRLARNRGIFTEFRYRL